ncbi:putative disease resistance protein isoform X1 [Cinnamomum micranthum f. kanehirae]|uniref:Putative disease resistance protein isoform X1 n=1 Tax=Cinnamomum micranthum f. kanehirae TaxID=337451 RepID=A0A3S3NBC5_9MAGN|nr:putative disease resistance protein isoform X1 [Cinnamomum micranthum f. kanehirae]
MASAVVTTVSGKLGNLLIQEAELLFEVKDHFKWIEEELRWMQRFLKDADYKQNEEERVKIWVEDIIQVSYDAEDVIDTFIYSQNAPRRRRGFAEWVRRCVCIVGELVSELITQYMVSKKIEKIKKRIRDIKERRETYGIRDIDEGRQEASSSTSSPQEHWQFSSDVKEPEVVGQEEEMNTLREQLISEEPSRSVISIVGMPGSGKTTLARKVYEDVKDGFSCHAFVTLSQQYKIKNILMDIRKCVMDLPGAEVEKLTEKELGVELRDHLKKMRYLVVIDDIWSREAWDDMRDLILPDVKNKSRVILTTRNKKLIPGDPTLRMRLLDDVEGWELFMKRIFPKEKNPSTACPAKEKGKEILAKCGGLPLVILVASGLLLKEPEKPIVWFDVHGSVEGHYLTESSNKCGRILYLGYSQLPYYLKPCFLYLGLLPEDYKISSGRLIRLWIAEGFIQPRNNAILEDIAEEYLNELVRRSMIQVASRKSNGSVGKCCIHDLLHDLSISEARQNNFFTIHNDRGTNSSSTSVRRLALHCNIGGYENRNRSTVTLRSILGFLGDEVSRPGPEDSAKPSRDRHTYSRQYTVRSSGPTVRSSGPQAEQWSLERTHCSLERTPTETCSLERTKCSLERTAHVFISPRQSLEVREFVLLRYLELGFYTKVSLPSSIGNLYNLETLRLSGCGTLPNAICNLKQLRHLCTYGFDIDEHPQLNNLRKLQTLCLTAGHWINDGLGQLTNLRKLGIDGDLSSYHEALSSSIHKLWNLRSLKLFRGCSIPPFMPFTHHLHLYKMLLEGHIEKPLEIPPNLVKLTLMGYESKQDVISELEKPLNVVVIPPFCILRYCHLGRRMKQEMKLQMEVHMSFSKEEESRAYTESRKNQEYFNTTCDNRCFDGFK